MNVQDAASLLNSSGWKTLNPASLPQNDLNAEASNYLIYADRLSARFFASENLFRLFIYGIASEPGFQVGFISQIDPSLDNIGHSDVRALQFEFEENELEDLVKAVIEIQDTVSIDSYFDAYFSLQAHASVSILAVEQFI